MSTIVKVRRGLNIPMEGRAENVLVRKNMSETYGVKPLDFPGLLPKLEVQEGDVVRAGTPLFYDKYRPEVKFSSPVSGEVVEIRRGERRQILEVVVKANGSVEYQVFGAAQPAALTRNQVVEKLLVSGVWPYIRQRPFGIVANPNDTPKAIFISCFDTAPLAPDMDFSIQGEDENFQAGIDALSKLTPGKIHLGLNADYPAASAFAKANGVEHHYFRGPHPAGNVGVHIHHIDPIGKGDVVWVVNPLDVVIIGRLFLKGIYDASRVIALAGSEVTSPRYYRVISGAQIDSITSGNLNSNIELRYISGNVLTGTKVEPFGYLGFYDNMVTVIPEGNHYEFFGWMSPGFNKFSASRTFLSRLTPWRKFKFDTNLHGGKRAYVITGQYEKVMPMDILPVHLIKAILANDIERMEQLGIYEVVEEDMALCEYVCTSKTDVQQILRKGIESLIKELS
ncbi:MAG TPA: Na(+)-translocating NADH-quinone reductase subunit A [Tenuifilaceae bacterium]|nr:Na(+)-translocating NADH-quinone reductase subunit A [Bacteroidales bacterium]HNY08983.1 Na(+)-translocating NADH-quinone reductase subunit A [Tenuifilaceae bacterium]MBP8642770.1 Na(+)-translocating NADH-quinone reductase subunit A [Bacteroidales bacterium]NLI88046.1 Na(+)-translocating NADH-quinone reductase subunit A [Bacteroidales bacterium]HOA08935.1 Na(+)-translocating NADH-quinone reductase subunit A [Tenuifilaceae bacterium]